MAWFRKPRSNKKPPAPAVERLETRDQPAANLLADLNTAPGSAFAAFPPFPGPYVGGPQVGATLGGSTYFAANDGTHPAAVWKSDGTAAGTKLVAALPSAANPYTPYPQPGNFTTAGGKVFFTHDDGKSGGELWVTDGTAAGTKRVTDLNPGPGGSYPMGLTAVGGRLVFAARTTDFAPGGGTLFATDGTEAGTVALRELGADYYTGFTTTGEKVYFVQHETNPYTYTPATRIWATDGTPAGTKAVALLPDGVGVDAYVGTSWVTAVGSKIYFAAGDMTHGRELWVSDGTAAGTKLVADINATTPFTPDPDWPAPTPGSDPNQLTAVGKTLYFAADDGKSGQELWRTDGTAAGTKMVADLNPGPETYPTNPYGNSGAAGSRITGLRAVGDKIFFSAHDGESGPQLYVSDGTAAGTVALTAVEHTPPDFFPTNPYGIPDAAPAPGPDFLTTNPYPVPGMMAEAPAILSAEPGRVLFSIADKAHGRQLWVTDGTKAGTKMVRQIGDADDGGALGPVAVGGAGGKLLFHADDGVSGRQLWATDGTGAGTGLVAKINATTLGSAPSGFVSAGGLAYFTAGGGVYATDGKSAPRLLTEFDAPAPGTGPWAMAEMPGQLTASGKGVYFVSRVGAAGLKLWRTDGTPAGTAVVKEVMLPANPGEVWVGTPAGIDNPTDVNGTLFFTVSTAADGQQLWKTDGTTKGTVLVRRLSDPPTPPDAPWLGAPPVVHAPTPVRQMTAVGGRLFFVAVGPGGEELWASDGTAAGTKPVKDIYPGESWSSPDDLTALGGKVYFTATSGPEGRQLWASDGTEAGTKQVARINPVGADSPVPPRTVWMPEDRDMVAAGGKLYFAARGTAVGGPEQLWVSDGTQAGTKAVSSLPGVAFYPWLPPETHIDGLTAAGGKVYFVASDEKYARQLYVSDGTAAGTKMVGPVGDGTQNAGLMYGFRPGANPVVLAADGGRVYFAADDGKAGQELWVTDGTAKGTKLVQDFFPGPVGGVGNGYVPAGSATIVNRRLVLAAGDPAHGSEPWSLPLPDAPTAPPVVPPTTPPVPAAVVTAIRVSATEGTAFSSRLAAVTLPPAADYKVTLLWGDGRSSTGTLTRNTPTGKAYTVTGGHKYADPGTYKVRVTITRAGKTVLAFDTTAVVADARFYAGRVAQRVAAGSPFSGVVATITDTNPAGGKASDYRATVNWGDGRTATATVRRTAAEKFEVVADTTFAAAGRRTVTVTITSVAGGKVATAESIFIVDPARPTRAGG